HLVHVIVHLEVGEADAHLEQPQRDGERDHGERELTEHDRRPSRLLKNGSPSHTGSGALRSPPAPPCRTRPGSGTPAASTAPTGRRPASRAPWRARRSGARGSA